MTCYVGHFFPLPPRESRSIMSNIGNNPLRPRIKLDYSLIGMNSTLAIEKGLAEVDWYQRAVTREIMRSLLERREGPAISDAVL